MTDVFAYNNDELKVHDASSTTWPNVYFTATTEDTCIMTRNARQSLNRTFPQIKFSTLFQTLFKKNITQCISINPAFLHPLLVGSKVVYTTHTYIYIIPYANL